LAQTEKGKICSKEKEESHVSLDFIPSKTTAGERKLGDTILKQEI